MEKTVCSFEINNKTVTVFPSPSADSPVIYMNTYREEGLRALEALMEFNRPDFTLVTVTELDWNRHMTPWAVPPIFEYDEPFTGEADEYLKLLLEEIAPAAEKNVLGSIPWRGLAGYSLAGLFAVYSMYRTEFFSRIASISGSLWYPGFKEYAFSREILKKPDRIYLSLGDRECRTSNPHLRTIQDNTEELADFYRSCGIDTVLQMNKGNHYKNAAKRTALGILNIIGGCIN